MGAEAFHNYAASFVAQHLHPLQFPKSMTGGRKSKATTAGTKPAPTAKPSTPAPTAPAQQKPMTQADRDDWAQAMGNRLKRKHEKTDQAHHDYLMDRSGEVLNRVQRERRAQYGSGEASDLLHTFNRRMDDIQGQTKPTGSGTSAPTSSPADMMSRAAAVKKSASAKQSARAGSDFDPHNHESRMNAVHEGLTSSVRQQRGLNLFPNTAPHTDPHPTGVFHADDLRASAKDPHGSIPQPIHPGQEPVSHADTHGQQFTGSAPKASAPKRSSGGYRAKEAHAGAWDGTFPHQEPVDLSGFDHAPVKDAPSRPTASPMRGPGEIHGDADEPARFAKATTEHLVKNARTTKFNGTMKEVGREGQDPGANRINARFTRHDGAPANWPKAGKQRAAQHGLFPVNQIKKVGRTKAPTPEPEHDPRTPGPGQTSLDFGHDSSAPIHNPKQFGQEHLF